MATEQEVLSGLAEIVNEVAGVPAAEAGRRIGGQDQVAERDPPGRGHRPAVPHL